MEDRTIVLLKAARELLIKQKDAGILIEHPLTVHYDDADCDGYCLIDDITAEIDIQSEKPHGVSVQEYIDLRTKYHNQKAKERHLYAKLKAWLDSLGDLQYSVSPDNPGHYPNPAEDTKIMHYTTTGDYILNGVLGMCRAILEIGVPEPVEVVKPSDNTRQFIREVAQELLAKCEEDKS